MSTAIDFSALMKRAKAKKSSGSNRVSTREQGVLKASEPDCKLARRPENAETLEKEYKVSPEGLERAFYVPNFVTSQEESYLLEKIYKGEEEEERSGKWVKLSHRRLMVYGGTPDAQGTLNRALPTWVDAFIEKCVDPFLKGTPPIDDFKKFDHVLLNEYSQGSGIAPHYDGSLYDSRVCVLNLQSRAVISFFKEEEVEEAKGEEASYVPSMASSGSQQGSLSSGEANATTLSRLGKSESRLEDERSIISSAHSNASEAPLTTSPASSSTTSSSTTSSTTSSSTTSFLPPASSSTTSFLPSSFMDPPSKPSSAMPPSSTTSSSSTLPSSSSSSTVPTTSSSQHRPTLKEVFCLVLEPRSLLIFEGALYKDYKHGIANAKEDEVKGRTIANASPFFLSSDSIDSITSSSPLSRGNLPRLSLTIRSIKNRSERSMMDVSTREEAEEIRRSEIQFYRNVSELN